MNLTDFKHLFHGACIQDIFGNPELLNITFKLANGNGAAISIRNNNGFLEATYSFDGFQTHTRKLIMLEDSVETKQYEYEYEDEGDTVS